MEGLRNEEERRVRVNLLERKVVEVVAEAEGIRCGCGGCGCRSLEEEAVAAEEEIAMTEREGEKLGWGGNGSVEKEGEERILLSVELCLYCVDQQIRTSYYQFYPFFWRDAPRLTTVPKSTADQMM